MDRKRTRQAATLVLALIALSLFGQSWSAAQPAGSWPPADERPPLGEAQPNESYRSMLGAVKDGGIMMLPLFACSFITSVFVLERAISLRRGRVIPRPFVKRFLHQVREGKLDRDGALELCQENGSAVAEVFAATARKWGRPSVEMEQTIIDAGDRVAANLRRYLRLFNAVATISPLMGLLGTVFGMIRLFRAISSTEVVGRAELLAAGISEALLATAAGLVVAIPALCCYLWFMGRVERLLVEIDRLGQELVGLISAEALLEERQGKRTKTRPPAAA